MSLPPNQCSMGYQDGPSDIGKEKSDHGSESTM